LQKILEGRRKVRDFFYVFQFASFKQNPSEFWSLGIWELRSADFMGFLF
jgi:hypothetical protein